MWYSTDCFPTECIGPVDICFVPRDDLSSNINVKVHLSIISIIILVQVWLWSHPACSDHILHELESLINTASDAISVHPIHDLLRFSLHGQGIIRALKTALRCVSSEDGESGNAFFEAAFNSEGLPRIWTDGAVIGLRVRDFRDVKFRKDELQSALVDSRESDAAFSVKRSCRRVTWSRDCARSSIWSRRSLKALSDTELNKMRHSLRNSVLFGQELDSRAVPLDPVPLLLTRRTVSNISTSLRAPPESTTTWVLLAPSSYGVNLLRCLGEA